MRFYVLALVAALSLPTLTVAGPAEGVPWLTTFEVAPGDTVAAWSLVDSFTLWPSSFNAKARDDYDAGHLEDVRYMFANKGDYLRAIVYVGEGSSLVLSSSTRIVFHYPDGDRATLEILAPAAARDGVSSSAHGLVLGGRSALARSTDGGFRVYLRFEPGSLPRPARWFGFGGNRWGVVRPDSCSVERSWE